MSVPTSTVKTSYSGQPPTPGKTTAGHFEDVAEVKAKYKKEIAEVRQIIELEEPDDVIVYRFLSGYKFDVASAAAALNKTLHWRKKNKLDAIRERAKNMKQNEFPNATKVMACYPHCVRHHDDRFGCPVSLERIKGLDPGELTKVLTLEEFFVYHMHHMEAKAHLMSQLTAKTGKVYRTVKIIDLSGLSMKHLHRQGLYYLKSVLQTTQAHYPELLDKLYIVNVPWVFSQLWRLVRPWLQPKTLEKIEICYNNFEDAVKERMDVAQLPEELGGDCQCPLGCIHQPNLEDSMEKLDVAAKGVEVAEDEVKESGLMRWEFRTKKRDIAYSVTFLPDNGSEIEVSPMTRVSSQTQTEKGQYHCQSSGKFRLTFDNTFSRWTGKTVVYMLSFAPGAVGAADDDLDEYPEDFEPELSMVSRVDSDVLEDVSAEAARAHMQSGPAVATLSPLALSRGVSAKSNP